MLNPSENSNICFEKCHLDCAVVEWKNPLSLCLPSRCQNPQGMYTWGGGLMLLGSCTSHLPSSRKPSKLYLVNTFSARCALTVPAGSTRAQAMARWDAGAGILGPAWTCPVWGQAAPAHAGLLVQTCSQYDSCIGRAVPGTLASVSQVHCSLVAYHLRKGVCSVKFDAFGIMSINANNI